MDDAAKLGANLDARVHVPLSHTGNGVCVFFPDVNVLPRGDLVLMAGAAVRLQWTALSQEAS